MILDEPTVGLDPIQVAELRELIRAWDSLIRWFSQATSSPEVSALCDRVLILSHGRLMAEDA